LDQESLDDVAGQSVISVDEAIRALVRQEVGQTTRPRNPQPSFLDAIMLGLLTINVALLFSFAPSKTSLDTLENGWLSLLSDKVVPWIASSVFVAGYTWWKDQLLRAMRKPGFRVANVLATLVLIATQVPLVPLHVRLSPQNAELWLDGERVDRSSGHWDDDSLYEYDLRVRLRPHDFEVKPPKEWKASEEMEQSIHFGWKRLFVAMTSGPTQPLSIVWPVVISATKSVGAITIIRDHEFGNDFLHASARGEGLRPAGPEETTLSVLVSSLGAKNSKLVHLPAGHYFFRTSDGSCQAELTISPDHQELEGPSTTLWCQ
jgi:hypothetical protein